MGDPSSAVFLVLSMGARTEVSHVFFTSLGFNNYFLHIGRIIFGAIKDHQLCKKVELILILGFTLAASAEPIKIYSSFSSKIFSPSYKGRILLDASEWCCGLLCPWLHSMH